MRLGVCHCEIHGLPPEFFDGGGWLDQTVECRSNSAITANTGSPKRPPVAPKINPHSEVFLPLTVAPGVALIFPNPLNRSKYVVLNTGHSFHEKDFKASNAQLYPRLGDAAVLRFRTDKKSGYSEEIVTGEIFNTQWELEE